MSELETVGSSISLDIASITAVNSKFADLNIAGMLLGAGTRSALQQIMQALESNSRAIILLEGFSGQGKNSLASFATELKNLTSIVVTPTDLANKQPSKTALVCDLESVDELVLIKAQLEKITTPLILCTADATPYLESLESHQGFLGLVKVPSLSHQETATLLKARKVNLTESEIELIAEYSLGVPILFDKMQADQPILKEKLREYSLNWLSDAILSISSDATLEGRIKIIEQRLKRKLPQDLLIENLLHDRKTVEHCFLSTSVPNALPRSENTIGIYENWYKHAASCDIEPSISIFVPQISKKLALQILTELGLEIPRADYIIYKNTRFGQLGALIRKVSACLDLDFTVLGNDRTKVMQRLHKFAGLNPIDNFGKSDGNGKLISESSLANLFIHISGHRRMPDNPARLGIGVETLLQATGLYYQVNYFDRETWVYNNEVHQMKAISFASLL